MGSTAPEKEDAGVVEFRCTTCNRIFSRGEHLKRHELSHNREKSFRCDQCNKDFVRKDALHRHLLTHQATGLNLRQKGSRACLTCAAAKVKCSGDLPSCMRCRKRLNPTCTYPENANNNNNSGLDQHSAQDSGLPYQSTMSSNNQQPTPGQSVLRFDHQYQHDNSGYGAVSMTENDEDGFWNPAMQSTINWLSNEQMVFPSETTMDGFGGDMLNNFAHPFLSPDAALPVPSRIEEPSQQISQNTFQTSSAPNTTGDGSNHSVHSTETTRSRSKRQPHDHVEGEYYVDGQPARLPRVKRRRLTMSTPYTSASTGNAFSLTIDINEASSDQQISDRIPDEVYAKLVETFGRLCISNPSFDDGRSAEYPHFIAFSPGIAPKSAFERLVAAFEDSFLNSLPILHHSQWCSSWQLVVVMSALGARYVPMNGSAELVASLNEFARRFIALAVSDESWLPESAFERVQVKLLHLVSMLYAGTMSSSEARTCLAGDLVHYCLRGWLRSDPPSGTDPLHLRWQQWVRDESCTRMGYAIWLLDAMISIHFHQPPTLNIESAIPNLPCHEALWEAETAEEWHDLFTRYSSIGSVADALQNLYICKKFPSSTGEYSRILIIHGLFRRLWEVEGYLRQPLSQWTPTAERHVGNTVTSPSIWLPSNSTYSRWRNSSCDCLDVLHWQANATIGAASGIEHPTVLHLHFARVILLTPYQNIVAIARHLVEGHWQSARSDITRDKQIVRRWALQDQYKARLAMIHAGVLFWHVRRYTANAFYEPASIAIATLALWAFSAFSDNQKEASQAGQDQNDRRSGDSDGEESICDIILLDRPTDDELVQQFVRDGHKMRANMNGVGDLYGRHAPERVLVEGRKLLRSVSQWTICDSWIKMLDSLIVICKRQLEDQTSMRT